VYRSWLQVVEWFSNCKLSFGEDCFPALSGLQRQFEEVLQDDYLVGMWRKDIINELGWFVKHETHGCELEVYPEKYIGIVT